MLIDVLTLFPSMFSGPLTESILARACENNIIHLTFHDLKKYWIGNYLQVDDKPYGGGVGMVMRADVVVSAIEAITKKHSGDPYRISLSPRGKRLTQAGVERLAKKNWLLFLCGHYEGIDERVIEGGWIDEEISIGDYVLTGGEIPAMVVIDAVARQLPGVLGKDESGCEESFSRVLGRKREYPHYTRPETFRNIHVPDVLLSGHHREIEKWRLDQLK
jgi:tRNA (guanine37-N1)-methyltransferase